MKKRAKLTRKKWFFFFLENHLFGLTIISFLVFLSLSRFVGANSSNLFITEIFPAPPKPEESKEWIEIFNQNDFEVDLSNWKIEDIKGKTHSYQFPQGTKIQAKGFLVLSRKTTKIILNNTGDGLYLIQPDGKIVDSVSYEKAVVGQSYNRFNSDWFWSSQISPGSENIKPNQIQKIKLSEKELTTSSKEKIESSPLAAISPSPLKEWSQRKISIFLFAFIIALISGIIILILKKKISKFDLKKEIE